MNEDTGKKLLIGGGAIVLGSILLNQIYTSGFQAGLIAGGGDPGAIARYGHGGFPFGFLFLLAIGGLIWWKVTNGGKRGPGGFFRGPRGMFDDRRQGWPQPSQQHVNQQQYGQQYATPQQSYPSQAPGAAPQPPAGYGAQGAYQQPPADYSPPTSPAFPQPDPGQPPAPPAAGDPNKPAI